jgi:hypothetical protein
MGEMMRIRAWMLLAVPALFTSLALLSAEMPPGRAVGSVYGKTVTAADIGLNAPLDPAVQFDARDTARWELMRRITRTFGAPVVERFVKQEKIEATPDEIMKFKSSFRKRNEAELTKQLTDIPEEVARMFIVAWKTERELHRVYGGRVIFQQAGPEAIDARRRLFEHAEKKGEIKFADAGVRQLFYYYSANMEHTFIDEKALERPWFLEDGN